MSKDKGKPNGKTIPPIAEVAEVLATVNERMTQGMMNEKEAVFLRPPGRLLNWKPAEDITAYELARAVMVLIVAVGGGDAFEVLDKQEPEVQRHFGEAEPPNEPA